MAIYRICQYAIWAYNFKNKEVRAMECLPLKSALNFDQYSKNQTLWLGNFEKKLMVYKFQAILSL